MTIQGRIAPLGDEKVHYWLVQGMARATGIDLVAAMDDGLLSSEAWADVVQRCRGCDWQRDGGGCSRWLALQEPGAAHVPDTCENKSIFALIDEARL